MTAEPSLLRPFRTRARGEIGRRWNPGDGG
jgi:hypothetical protein